MMTDIFSRSPPGHRNLSVVSGGVVVDPCGSCLVEFGGVPLRDHSSFHVREGPALEHGDDTIADGQGIIRSARNDHDEHRQRRKPPHQVPGLAPRVTLVRLWSLLTAARATESMASSPWPSTHSGSGPSSGMPVKNLAAMHPP